VGYSSLPLKEYFGPVNSLGILISIPRFFIGLFLISVVTACKPKFVPLPLN